MESLFSLLAKEGRVILQAPTTFGLALFLCFGIAWAAINWAYAARFDSQASSIVSLEGRLKLKDDQLIDYKEKLNGATPEDAKRRIDALELKIKALSPRRISENQKKSIIDALNGTRGIISISQDMAAPDAKGLSSDLGTTFQSAGWGVVLPMVMGPSNIPPTGLGLRVRNPNALRPIEQRVQSALLAGGVEFDLQGGLRESPKRPPLPQGFPTLPEESDPDVEILITTSLR